MAENANGVYEKAVEVEGDLVKQGLMYDGESGEQIKNCDDDNVMIGENIDEIKANLGATQRPNINSEDDGDNIPTTGNRDRSSLQTVEEDEERKDNPLHTDDDGDNIPTTGNRDRSSLQTVEEVEERKDHPLRSDDDGVIDHHCKQLKKLQCEQMILCTMMMQVNLGMTRPPPKSMETEMKDREIMFSDSDVENEIDGDKELTDIIDTLAEEIIETLAEETVSKYYPLETNEEREEAQCPNPRLDSAHKLSKVLSSDVESGDEEDNYSLAKLRALNQLKETLHEGTPMSMEEYRLRNEEELDAKTVAIWVRMTLSAK